MQKQQNNQNFFVTKSENFNNLSEEDKNKYKLFMSTILKLARNTKRIEKELPELPDMEYPVFTIVDKSGIAETLSWEDNKWLIKSENLDFANSFNPTAISGIIEFLNNFLYIDIENGAELFQEEINELYLKYGIKY